jgi:protein SCO1/2
MYCWKTEMTDMGSGRPLRPLKQGTSGKGARALIRHRPSGRAVFIAMIVMLVAAMPRASLAHNVGDVESSLRENERYMQPVSRAAPDFRLQDPDGNLFALEDFHGKVIVLNFLYSRCEEECPLHSLKIAEIQRQIAEASLSDHVQFLTIATDTEAGSLTAESMRDHGAKFGLGPGNWKFLFGGIGGERMGIALAESYGLKFVPTGSGEQMHGVVTFVIDPQGWLRAKFHGLKFDPLNLTVYAAALVHSDHATGGSTVKDEVAARTGTASRALKASEWLAILVGLGSLFLVVWAGYGFFRERRTKLQRPESRAPDA